MVITTVWNILNGDDVDYHGPIMYVVQDKDGPLYVGITRDCIYNRFERHVFTGSKLGRLIGSGDKRALSLRVEIWEPKDWTKWSLSQRVNKLGKTRTDIHLAEELMIHRHHPPLNTMLNHKPRKAPEWVSDIIDVPHEKIIEALLSVSYI